MNAGYISSFGPAAQLWTHLRRVALASASSDTCPATTSASWIAAWSEASSPVVANEPGILARVVGLFSGRGYNIESLTVAETNAKESQSRITIVTKGTPMIIEQIKAQLDRLVPVYRVRDLTVEGPHIERELALVKVKGVGEKRVEALRLADVFRAKVIDAKSDSFVFEVTGNTDKVQTFIGLMEDLGMVDVVRTGIVAMSRGGEPL
ncbi:MAG: acetolactate synthase small subunit [Proteobacteria bacterium]|nr:acetolactate synthase small subunit [Pseudomonadota bacterium]